MSSDQSVCNEFIYCCFVCAPQQNQIKSSSYIKISWHSYDIMTLHCIAESDEDRTYEGEGMQSIKLGAAKQRHHTHRQTCAHAQSHVNNFICGAI